MSDQDAWQLAHDAAVAYEKHFVPAIFAQWPPVLAEVAETKPGDRVLEVACGTGILAREAADRVGPTGRVTGLDLNEAMLAVARRLRPGIDWRQGDEGVAGAHSRRRGPEHVGASWRSPEVKAAPKCRPTLADREGFEPPEDLRPRPLSRRMHSTTLPPVLGASV